eukprot:scaffold103786_cov27-Prasinocladus_malaysianus.AAC.2
MSLQQVSFCYIADSSIISSFDNATDSAYYFAQKGCTAICSGIALFVLNCILVHLRLILPVIFGGPTMPGGPQDGR